MHPTKSRPRGASVISLLSKLLLLMTFLSAPRLSDCSRPHLRGRQLRPLRYALYTYVAGNNTQYIRWASLQHFAARKYAPRSKHIVLVAKTAGAHVVSALRASGAQVEVIEPLEEAHQHASNWVNQLTKLQLWTRTEYDMVCHMDSDVIFFTDVAHPLVYECEKHLFGASPAADICAYENESCECCGPFNEWNRKHWGQPYMEASIFCLRPSVAMYNKMLAAGVQELQAKGSIQMRGRDVRTEQDFLNMFFTGRIFYYPCNPKAGGRADGLIVHTKDMEAVWREKVGDLPVSVFPVV